jgi:hypothetical protein
MTQPDLNQLQIDTGLKQMSGVSDKGKSRPIALKSVFIEELDTANSNGAGASGPFFNIFGIEKIITQFFFC